MGKGSSPSSTAVHAEQMSEEMEAVVIKQIEEQTKMARDAWDEWKIRDTAPDGTSITGKMNLQRLEGMTTIEEYKDLLTAPLPDVNPGIAPAVDAINSAMGNEIASSNKQLAMMNPYGSAREDATQRSNEFRRSSEIAKTKGAMTADWNLKKRDYDKNAIYNYASAMQTGAPINSDTLTTSAGSLSGASSKNALGLMGVYDDRIADERANETARQNAQWSALGSVAGWFTGRR